MSYLHKVKFREDGYPSLMPTRNLRLRQNISQGAMIRANGKLNTQQLVPKVQYPVTQTQKLLVICAIVHLSRIEASAVITYRMRVAMVVELLQDCADASFAGIAEKFRLAIYVEIL